jgi:hypothetical protein
MMLVFWYRVHDRGSWSEISASIGGFYTSSLLFIISAGMGGLGEWLMKDTVGGCLLESVAMGCVGNGEMRRSREGNEKVTSGTNGVTYNTK